MLLRLITATLRPYRTALVIIFFFQLVAVATNLYLPALNAAVVDKGISRGDTHYIWFIGAIMIAVSLGQIVAMVAGTYFAALTSMRFGRDIRSALFHRVGTFSAREVKAFGAPSLITRTTNDVQQIQTLVLMALTLMAAAPIMAVGGIFMALREDVGLSWLVLVAVPFLGVVMGIAIFRMVPGFRLVQTRLDVVNKILREQLTGVRVVRAFQRERYEDNRFGDANTALTDASTRVMRLMAIMFPIVTGVMNISTVAVWWFGAHRIESGHMEIGGLTAYMNYLIQILTSVIMATFMLMMVPRASVSAERITEVLDTRSSVVPPQKPAPLQQLSGLIRFDGVGLTYPGADAPVICDASFAAAPGQTVAIIGSTGSGKTTLISLVARLFDATAGVVSIDGVDVRQIDPAVLWSSIGIVPQRAYLFSGTVATNLRYGNPDATDDDLWDALEVAQSRGFVERLGGLDADIAQGGTNVSGGQRQRLCIARALVAKPRIYLFDDSFSALDLATDARLRGALAPRVGDATILLVAQRVSTITGADAIVVLDEGKVVGIGTHAELLASCPTYVEIASSQRQESPA